MLNNQNIKLALREALKSNVTPKEIYDEIVNTLESEVEEGKRAVDLLLFVKGNLSALYSTNEETAYWNGELEGENFDRALAKYGYEYTPTPATKEEPKTYDEMIAAGWEMTGDGFWWPPQKD